MQEVDFSGCCGVLTRFTSRPSHSHLKTYTRPTKAQRHSLSRLTVSSQLGQEIIRGLRELPGSWFSPGATCVLSPGNEGSEQRPNPLVWVRHNSEGLFQFQNSSEDWLRTWLLWQSRPASPCCPVLLPPLTGVFPRAFPNKLHWIICLQVCLSGSPT